MCQNSHRVVKTSAERIQLLLDERGMMQKELAALLHTDATYISKIVNGKAKLSKSLAHELEKISGYRAGYFLCEDDAKTLDDLRDIETAKAVEDFSGLRESVILQVSAFGAFLASFGYNVEAIPDESTDKITHYVIKYGEREEQYRVLTVDEYSRMRDEAARYIEFMAQRCIEWRVPSSHDEEADPDLVSEAFERIEQAQKMANETFKDTEEQVKKDAEKWFEVQHYAE